MQRPFFILDGGKAGHAEQDQSNGKWKKAEVSLFEVFCSTC